MSRRRGVEVNEVSEAGGRSGPRPGGVRVAAGGQVAEIQRSRLLAAAVRAFDEQGYSNTTVADIIARSRVSRRTFYEMFSSREDCFVAVLDQAVDAIERELAQAGIEGLEWRERMRAGLGAILTFFDREPALARVCVVHSLAGGSLVLARRERLVAALVREVDRGRGEDGRRGRLSELTAEGVVGAVSAIVYARLLELARRAPLTGLLGELMAMIVLPYLGATAARREGERRLPAPAPRRGRAAGEALAVEDDPLEGVRMRVTYRTASVLVAILQQPGASNRRIAEAARIADPAQVSKLLRRLERLGLIANGGPGHAAGEANAWRLTDKGDAVTRSIQRHASDPEGLQVG